MEMTIGFNIKRLRLSRDITQEQLSEAMNVSCAAVSKWERGETYPDITLLQPLAYYFDVSLDELMGYSSNKIEQKVEEILIQYRELYGKDSNASRDLIVKARADYPNDYRIMHYYMWHIAGDYADNDQQVLISHREEFLDICKKILDGCPDNHIRLSALNMKAKLLWAEGKTQEALEVYKNNFSDWHETIGQKSEQLFAKNTPEFLYWAKKNMYTLAAFAADKFVKVHFYDEQLSMREKVEKIELYGDMISRLRKETGEAFFAVIEQSIFRRLRNDLMYRGGADTDVIRITEKYLFATEAITELSETDSVLSETTAGSAEKNLLKWTVKYFLSAENGRPSELLKNKEYTAILEKFMS